MVDARANYRSRSAPSLAEIKRRTLKPVDAWWTVIVIDPVAVRLIWLLLRVWPRVSPAAVTTASLGFGVLATVAFYCGRYVLGGILYQVAFLCDCMDGKISRLRGTSSPRGAFYDGLVGITIYVAAVFALMLHTVEQTPLLAAGLGGALLSLAAISYFTSIYVEQAVEGVHSPFAPQEGGWLRRRRLLAPGAFPDRHAVLFLFGPWMGFVFEAMAVVGILELLVVAAKVRKVFMNSPAGVAVPDHVLPIVEALPDRSREELEVVRT